jgi:hypothetical protein
MMAGVCTLVVATKVSVVVCAKTFRNVVVVVPPIPILFATNILRPAVIFPANRLPTALILVDTFKALAVRVDRTLKLPLTVEKAVLGGYAALLIEDTFRFWLSARLDPTISPAGPIVVAPIVASGAITLPAITFIPFCDIRLLPVIFPFAVKSLERNTSRAVISPVIVIDDANNVLVTVKFPNTVD